MTQKKTTRQKNPTIIKTDEGLVSSLPLLRYGTRLQILLSLFFTEGTLARLNEWRRRCGTTTVPFEAPPTGERENQSFFLLLCFLSQKASYDEMRSDVLVFCSLSHATIIIIKKKQLKKKQKQNNNVAPTVTGTNTKGSMLLVSVTDNEGGGGLRCVRHKHLGGFRKKELVKSHFDKDLAP